MEGDLRWCCGSSSNDWDLHAVVRLAICSSGSRVITSPRASDESFSCLPATRSRSHKDDDEVAPATAALQQIPIGGPAVDDFGLLQAFLATLSPPQPRNEEAPPPPQPIRSKRMKKKKKSQVRHKEVTRVPVGASPAADPWGWRKYGQKPIKGSPYPRSYYRCSTDKECRARKQVERCRTDPSTLIVCYTGGEHSHPVPLHRNALAGTTRKPHPTSSPSSRSISPSAEQRQPPAASPIDETIKQEQQEEENTVAGSARGLLLEYAEMDQGEEDVLSLFLDPVPSPSNGNGGSDTKDVEDITVFAEPHGTAPGADSARGRGSEKVVPLSKLDELTLPATTSSSRTDDGSGAAPAAKNVTGERCPFSGLTPWEAAAVAAATNWG